MQTNKISNGLANLKAFDKSLLNEVEAGCIVIVLIFVGTIPDSMRLCVEESSCYTLNTFVCVI